MRISFEELDQVIEGFIAVSLLGERGLVPERSLLYRSAPAAGL